MSRTSSFVRALALAVAIALSVLSGVGAAPSQAAPAYGPYSSEFYDVKARASLPSARQAKAYVQVVRNAERTGDRQVLFAWKIQGQKLRKSSIRDLGPGGAITFATTNLGCGKKMTVTLTGRARASSGGAWSDWKTLSVDVSRRC
ncbi:MAG: hypothetical protein WB767_14180 [Nocardioides sp.]